MELFGGIRTTFQVQTCPNTSESLEKLFQTSKKIKNRNAFAKTVKLFPSLVCLELNLIGILKSILKLKTHQERPQSVRERGTIRYETGWYCQLYIFLLFCSITWHANINQGRIGLVLPTPRLIFFGWLFVWLFLVDYFPCKCLSRLKWVGIANSTSSFFVNRLLWDTTNVLRD